MEGFFIFEQIRFMENKTIARTLRLLSQLMELHNENPFKIKSMANAAFKVDKLPYALASKSLAEIEQVDGLGKSTASKVYELIQTNSIKDLQELFQQTPIGVVDMLQIKGIGPKKIGVIWKDLGIESTGELYYACNENRLVEAKGFGLKTQEEIKKVIEFKKASSGHYLYARVEQFANDLLTSLQKNWKTDLISFTGNFRRKCEIIDGLDLLCGIKKPTGIEELFSNLGLNLQTGTGDKRKAENDEGLKI